MVLDDPLRGLRGVVLAAAINTADMAVEWEKSGGDPVIALKLRRSALDYEHMNGMLKQMQKSMQGLDKEKEG